MAVGDVTVTLAIHRIQNLANKPVVVPAAALSCDRQCDGEIRRKPDASESDVLQDIRITPSDRLLSIGGAQEYVLVPPEAIAEQDPSAIIWPTTDVPQTPRVTVSFFRRCEFLR